MNNIAGALYRVITITIPHNIIIIVVVVVGFVSTYKDDQQTIQC